MTKRGYRKAHMYAALLQILLAAVSIAESFRFPYWEEFTGPGAGFVPLWLGIIWLPIAFGLLWQSRAVIPGEEAPVIMPQGKEARRLGAFALILVGFMVTFPYLGAIISVAAFVGVSLKLFEDYTWKNAAITGSIISVVLYLLFRTWLNVPLPKGVLFFL